MNEKVRGYVRTFRVKELQQVLTQLGLSRTGRKAELVDRLNIYANAANGGALPNGSSTPISDTDAWRTRAVETIITEVYAALNGTAALPRGQEPPNPLLQSGVGAASGGEQMGMGTSPAHRKLPGGSRFVLKLNSDKFANARSTAIRCPCGTFVEQGQMIQCEGDKCGVWQHCPCAGIDSAHLPDHFFCEWCRASDSDPFWVATNRTLMAPCVLRAVPNRAPAYLTPGERPQPAISAERSFVLSPQDAQAARTDNNVRLQVMCVQEGDPVPQRFHWPRVADLRVNGMQYHVYPRRGDTKQGNNGRDAPSDVGAMCYSGRNKLSLSGNDDRTHVVMLQVARLRTIEEVKELMAPPVEISAAIADVRHKLIGKDTTAAAGGVKVEDSDDEGFEATSMIVSLRCPLSGARIVTPARFSVPGLACFDLDTFLDLAKRTLKWQCPHSMRNMGVAQLQIDTYVSRLLAFLKGQPDVLEVEVNTEGLWRYTGNATAPWYDINADAATVKPLAPVPTPGLDQAQALSDSDEESESAELRQAITALAATAKRKREPPPQNEVIVLSDSDDDEPPARRQATGVVHTQQLQPAQRYMQNGHAPSADSSHEAAQSSGAARSGGPPQPISRQSTVLQGFSRAEQLSQARGPTRAPTSAPYLQPLPQSSASIPGLAFRHQHHQQVGHPTWAPQGQQYAAPSTAARIPGNSSDGSSGGGGRAVTSVANHSWQTPLPASGVTHPAGRAVMPHIGSSAGLPPEPALPNGAAPTLGLPSPHSWQHRHHQLQLEQQRQQVQQQQLQQQQQQQQQQQKQQQQQQEEATLLSSLAEHPGVSKPGEPLLQHSRGTRLSQQEQEDLLEAAMIPEDSFEDYNAATAADDFADDGYDFAFTH